MDQGNDDAQEPEGDEPEVRTHPEYTFLSFFTRDRADGDGP